MKKFLVTVAVAMMTAVGASAQESGDFAIGLRGGVSIAKVEIDGLEIKDNSSRFGIGAFAQYNLANHWRVELEGVYHPAKDHVSDFTAALNLHYLINLNSDHTFKLYPILGYGLAFVHSESFTEGGRTVSGDNSTDGGLQIGLGAQVDVSDNWFLSADYKYQPGIFGDGHVITASIGYRF